VKVIDTTNANSKGDNKASREDWGGSTWEFPRPPTELGGTVTLMVTESIQIKIRRVRTAAVTQHYNLSYMGYRN
jgi:hypothetical protein